MLGGNLRRDIAHRELGSGEETTSVTLAVPGSGLPFAALHLFARDNVLSTTGTIDVALRFNADTAGNYNRQELIGAGGSPTASRDSAATSFEIHRAGATAFQFTGGVAFIADAFSTRSFKSILSMGGNVENEMHIDAGNWAKAGNPVITSVTWIAIGGGSFDVGSMFTVSVADEKFAIAGAAEILTADGTFTVQGIPELPGDVVLIGNLRGAASADEVALDYDLNDDATDGNYKRQYLRGDGASPTAQSASDREIGVCPGDTAAANAFGAFVQTILNSAGGTNDPGSLVLSGHHADSTDSQVQVVSQRRNNVGAVTKYKLAPATGTDFVTGSMLSAYLVPKNIIVRTKLEADAASVTLTVPQGYRDAKVSCSLRGAKSSSNDNMRIIVNSDATASKYDWQHLQADGGSASSGSVTNNPTTTNIPAASDIPNVFASAQFTFFEYTKADRYKHYLQVTGHTGAFPHLRVSSHVYKDAAPITTLTFSLTSGEDFAAGSIFTIEGIGKDLIGWEDQQVEVVTQVVVDWGLTGTFDGTYDDITAAGDVTAAKILGGRDVASTLSGRVKASRLTLTVANDDDRYSRDNTGSVLTGNVLPKRPVQVRSISPVFRELFTGHIDRPVTTVLSNGKKVATITCRGVFAALTKNEISVPFAATIGSGAAVIAVLDAAGQDSGARSIDAGQTTFENWIVDDIQAMTALRQIEESEPGLLREGRGGDVIWEDRSHRLGHPHLIAVAEYSDDPDALGVLRYESISQLDSAGFIFNDFRNTVRRRAIESGIVLWTHPEANTTGDAPFIEPGESVEYWAGYPNAASRTDARGVAVWTPLVSTTDYLTNAASNGGGTDLTASLGVAESPFSKRKKIILTNNHASTRMYLTKLQNRGDALYDLDPVGVRSEDAVSQDKYGLSFFSRSILAVWVPDVVSAQEWCDYMLSLFKDPSPMIRIRTTAQRNLYQAVDALSREVSDRVGIEGDGNAGLGVNEDFIVEAYEYRIKPGKLTAIFRCSSAAAFSAYWTLGFSILGSETRLNPS